MKALSINYKALMVTACSFSIAYGCMRGTVQHYIHFAGPLNEIGVCALALGAGVIAAAYTFSWGTKNS